MNIKEVKSEALCSWIVAYRTVGALKGKSIEAMQELLVREKAGDEFDYESYITKQTQQVTPDKTMSLDDLIEVVSKFENESIRRK